jgi:hypothetical protein
VQKHKHLQRAKREVANNKTQTSYHIYSQQDKVAKTQPPTKKMHLDKVLN